MKKKDLISKWLDNNLNDDELKTFEQSDVFSSYHKISQTAKRFRAPEFNLQANYSKITEQKTKSSERNSWIRYATGIAAAVLITFGLFNFLNKSSEVEFLALNAETTELTLPDNSIVSLNAGSELTYNKENWESERTLSLEGEAYFKVSKGEKFTVQTTQGEVSVLGTQFKVKDRGNFFEVTCYEGLVQVEFDNKKYLVPAGNNFRVLNNNIEEVLTAQTEPSWVAEKSMFKSVPLENILTEMERQYNVSINADNIDTQIIFTGGFTHKNLDTALQSITIPLNLSFEISKNTVTLKNE